ncbi:phage tail length tape measure family protein [Xanthobacter autotrophicus]|uniref:phage tail length tape measure family protein n=1 Tax=Xanthobacter autotrophicus TaxID=280 RepID=UPI003729D38C
MADDIARLGLAIDSAPAAKASQELDKFVNSSKRAEAANDDLASAAEAAGRGIDRITRETKGARAALEQAATAARSVEAAAAALGRNAIAPTVAYVRAIDQVNNALRVQQQINRSVGVRPLADAAGRASDIAAFGDALDDLRAKFNPLFAAERQHRETIGEIAEAARVGAISEKERADAITRTTAVYEAQVAQIRRLEGALRNQAAAAKAAAQAAVARQTITPDRGADIAAYGAELDRLRAKYNPLYAAGQQYRQTLKEINEAAKVGAISERERVAALDRTKTAFATQVVQLDHVAKSSGLAGYQMMNLSRQMNDVATMALMGASPFQIITSQAGQVYQVLQEGQGGVTGSLKYLGERLMGLVTPARAVAAGLAGIGIAAGLAYSSYLDGQYQLQRSLQGLGGSTNATVSQLEAIAEAGAAASKISVSASRDLTAAFASTGKIGKETFSGLIEVTTRYAALTQKDLAEAGADLAAAFADPAKGAQDLDQKLNFLNVETLRYIRNLADTNQKGQAQKVLLDELTKALPSATTYVTALGRAWQGVAGFADGAYVAMGKAINSLFEGPDLDAQIKALEKLVADQRIAAAGPRGRASGAAAASLQVNEQKLADLYKKQADEKERAAKKQDELAAKAAQVIAQERDPRIDELESLTKQASALQAAIDKGTGNTQLYRETLEGVNNQIQALTGNDGQLLSVAEKLRRERELELAVIKETRPVQKAEAQAALDAYRAKERGATNAAAAAEAEDGKIKALAQVYAGMSQAARQRMQAAQEAIAQQQLETQLIGKTAEETALLRANFQTYWELRREAAQNGTAFDEAEYEALKKKNEEMAKGVQLAARLKLQNDLLFERSQFGRTEGDQQIASSLRSLGLPVDLDSYEAGLMRVNAQLKDMRDTASTALSGFASDMLRGASAAEALSNQLASIADKLLKMAMDQLVAQAFGGLLGNGSGSGLLSGLLGGGGTVGNTAGAMYVAGNHSGGIIGRDQTFTRGVSPWAFLDTPKFHTGGGFFANNERPAILQVGEEVLTRDDPRHILNFGRIRRPDVGTFDGGAAGAITTSFSPTFNIDATGSNMTQGEIQAMALGAVQAWWKGQRGDVVRIIRDARSRRVPGV